MNRIAGTVAAVLLVAALPAHAREETPREPVSRFVLGNGLELVVIPDRRAPVVTHMIWYKVGSADEEPGKSGIAHIFEHLMFKGTKTVAQGVFSRRIAEIGGQENAFTSYDYTAYHQQVDPSALGDMMRLEADRMRNLVLTDEVIGPERNVIIEERNSRVENDPGSLLSEEIDATLYQNHPYRLPVIGWMHEIEKLNRTDATAFYDRYYAPNNAVVVIAGDIDGATALSLARQTYGQVPRGPDLPPRDRPQEPEQNAARSVTLSDSRVTQPSVQRNWVVPSYTSAARDGLEGEAEALDILSEILGGGIRSRLYQALVVRQGIASGAGAYYTGTALDATDMGVYGSPRGSATLEQVEKAIDAEIARIVAEGVTQEEVDRARNRFLRSLIFARDNQAGMARIYGSTLTTGGTIADIDEWPARVEKVTPEQVQAVAAKYLQNSRAVTGYLLPAAKEAN